MNTFTAIIAKALQLKDTNVDNTLQLLDEGCTIPFISRYRKERTGGLNEVQIAEINDSCEKLEELAHRREYILNTIEEQGKTQGDHRQDHQRTGKDDRHPAKAN